MKLVYVILGILLPFILTSFGSSFVFFLKNELNNNIKKLLIGLSIGVMLASSIFSLLIPSIEISKIKWLIPSIGIIFGFLFLMLINRITSKSINMTMFSVTLHNIPEGMVVGAAMAGILLGIKTMSIVDALLISIGISIQNIPEGTIISIPYRLKGYSKYKSFMYGVLSGVVEPIFAVLTIILSKYIIIILPFLLSFAAGAMIYVIIDELASELNENKSYFGMIGVMIGFVIMMILDIALS